MNGFLRPEMRKWLSRWGEPLGAALVALFGARVLWRGVVRYDWMLELVGLFFLLIGLAAGWAAFRRAQFTVGNTGPGLVEVTERRITYMTPEGGGFVDIEAMTRLEMRRAWDRGRVWALKQSDGPSLYIPIDATGADKLFDAFSVLPGMDPAMLIAASNADGDHRMVIWRGKGRFLSLT